MKNASLAILLVLLTAPAFTAPAASPAEPRDTSASGRAVRLSRPTKVGVTAADKSKLVGQVIWHDAVGFELVDEKDHPRIVRWSELSAQSAYEVYDKILGKATAEEWVQAGWVLRNLPGGTPMSDRAFGRALNFGAKFQ